MTVNSGDVVFGGMHPESKTLLERAEGMSRKQAMKEVVGPAITDLLRPVYALTFIPDETAAIPAATNFGESVQIAETADQILIKRMEVQSGLRKREFTVLDDLVKARRDLFHRGTGPSVLTEGIRSGIIIPFNVAVHVFRLENRLPYGTLNWRRFDHSAIGAVLERESIGEILRDHLTKGPTTFVGSGSMEAKAAFASTFFDFPDLIGNGYLPIEAAYEMEQGRVTGLSAAYYQAAAIKRRQIQARFRQRTLENPHQIGISDGCPVRHEFENERSVTETSIITDSRMFLAAVLAISQAKTQSAV
jgi:hypothetical protein